MNTVPLSSLTLILALIFAIALTVALPFVLSLNLGVVLTLILPFSLLLDVITNPATIVTKIIVVLHVIVLPFPVKLDVAHCCPQPVLGVRHAPQELQDLAPLLSGNVGHQHSRCG
ncbi:hypothetical protein GE09DRAFT_1052392 [Coniochaeta sp. 2T2.1]|nr:hypothetical protein GE09DRAFT_1052392 [Coniochaeta sp. 2T2.1]